MQKKNKLWSILQALEKWYLKLILMRPILLLDVLFWIALPNNLKFHYSNGPFLKFQTAYQRHHKMGVYFENLTVSGSEMKKHQLLCTFNIYLHNAKGLQDGQSVNIIFDITYQQNRQHVYCPQHQLNLTARTTILVSWGSRITKI
jgi:hypothetical protein